MARISHGVWPCLANSMGGVETANVECMISCRASLGSAKKLLLNLGRKIFCELSNYSNLWELMTLALPIRVTSKYRFCRQKKHLKDCFYKSIKKCESMGSFYTASEKQCATMREKNDKWLSELYISFQKTQAQEKKQPTHPFDCFGFEAFSKRETISCFSNPHKGHWDSCKHFSPSH